MALVGFVGWLVSLANAQTEKSADIQAKREQRDTTVWKVEALPKLTENHCCFRFA